MPIDGAVLTVHTVSMIRTIEKPVLYVAMIRRTSRQFSAHVQDEAGGAEVFGADLLKGRGLVDETASWLRVLFESAQLLGYYALTPVRRPELDAKPGERNSSLQLFQRAAKIRSSNANQNGATPQDGNLSI